MFCFEDSSRDCLFALHYDKGDHYPRVLDPFFPEGKINCQVRWGGPPGQKLKQRKLSHFPLSPLNCQSQVLPIFRDSIPLSQSKWYCHSPFMLSNGCSLIVDTLLFLLAHRELTMLPISSVATLDLHILFAGSFLYSPCDPAFGTGSFIFPFVYILHCIILFYFNWKLCIVSSISFVIVGEGVASLCKKSSLPPMFARSQKQCGSWARFIFYGVFCVQRPHVGTVCVAFVVVSKHGFERKSTHHLRLWN